MKNGKVWGCNFPLFDKSNVEVNGIRVEAGGYSSRHKHEHKHNLFFVVYGQMEIEVEKNDYELTDTTMLSAGEMTDVAPGEWHGFRCPVPTFAIEIYYTELDSADIERKDSGGVA